MSVDLLTGRGFFGDAESDVAVDVENVTGSDFVGVLQGDSGPNTLNGRDGGDLLTGRGKLDLIGGTGADHLLFAGTGKASLTRDHIADLSALEGDIIQLDLIDAKQASVGDDVFIFIGTKAFSVERQVRAFFKDDHTMVEVNPSGVSGTGMEIELASHVSLCTVASSSDLMLPACIRDDGAVRRSAGIARPFHRGRVLLSHAHACERAFVSRGGRTSAPAKQCL